MAIRDLLHSRVALRIYLVGLAQMAVVGAGFSVLLSATRPFRAENAGQARFIVGVIESVIEDRRAIEDYVQRARQDLRRTITVVDPDGAIVATTANPDTPRCPPPSQTGPPGAGQPTCMNVPLRFPGGRAGHIEFVGPPV